MCAYSDCRRDCAVSSRWASAIQVVRPLESTAGTQPQLQPALLRLSAMISQYFIYALRFRFSIRAAQVEPKIVERDKRPAPVNSHRSRCLAPLFVQSRAYQMSVTLPARVPALPLWIRIVSALATWMSTWWKLSKYKMWVPTAPLTPPWVMVALGVDSKPTHNMPTPAACCKVT
jgi:hypothetical protein